MSEKKNASDEPPQELIFQIKESGAKEWYATSTYKPNEIGDSKTHPFGFPLIEQAKDKEFDVRLALANTQSKENVYLNIDNGVVLHSVNQTNKKELLTHPAKLINLLLQRFSNVATNDNSIQTQSLVSSMLPSYSFVAGKPVIKFENWSRAGLQNGSVKVAEISIGADSGDIKINNIPFSIRKSSPFAISGYSIVDESGTAISGVNIPAYESGVDFSFSNGGYVIQSGTTKKFSIYATVSGLSGNGSYVRFMLRDKADNLFTWSDLVSNKNLLTASLLDYPTNTQTTTSGNVAIPSSFPSCLPRV
jgi:hypothetical protein